MAARGSREQARERELRAWELRKQGLTERAIADDLGVSQPAVNKMLQKTRAAFLDKIEGAIREELALQVGHLHYVIEQALEAWRDSKKPKKVVVTKKTKNLPGLIKEESTASNETRLGDPRYFDSAMEAMAEVRKILAMLKPTQLLGGGTEPGRSSAPSLDKLTEVERAERIAMLFSRAAQRQTAAGNEGIE